MGVHSSVDTSKYLPVINWKNLSRQGEMLLLLMAGRQQEFTVGIQKEQSSIEIKIIVSKFYNFTKIGLSVLALRRWLLDLQASALL